jgi:hypothetical protein
VGEAVEYQVVLIESFKVFKKTISETYKFKTRYSKLEALHRRAGGQGFPGKKIFGNKDPLFIEERKKQLEAYLNGIANSNNRELLKLVSQIKQTHLEETLKSGFRLLA